MLFEEARVGMKVYFGRGRGEQTLGIIRKKNPTKANIETLEDRGQNGRSPVGTVWHVPYSMIRPADQNAAPGSVPPPPQREKLKYNVFQPPVEKHILLAIADCYSGLSPENLTADGELPRTEVNRRAAVLNRQLRGLFAAFGRDVDEMEVYEWVREYEADQRQREQRRVANSR